MLFIFIFILPSSKSPSVCFAGHHHQRCPLSLSCHHQRRQAFVSLAIITSNALYLYLYLAIIKVAQRLFRWPSSPAMPFIFILPSSTSPNICFARHHHQRCTCTKSQSSVTPQQAFLLYNDLETEVTSRKKSMLKVFFSLLQP